MSEQMPERIWLSEGYGIMAIHHKGEDRIGSPAGTEYILAAPVTAELTRLRGLLREAREGFDRIIGMCDAPSRCTCGRPNGLPAVVACALSHSDAITAEVDGEPTIPVPLTDLRRIQSDLSLQTAKAMDREPKPTALEKQMLEALDYGIQNCLCGGTGVEYLEIEEEVGQPPGSSAIDCPLCTPLREARAAYLQRYGEEAHDGN